MSQDEMLGPNIEKIVLKDSEMTEDELRKKLQTEDGLKEILRDGADCLEYFDMAAFVAKMMVAQSGLLHGMKQVVEDRYWFETAGVEQFRCSVYGFFIQIDDVDFFLSTVPHFKVESLYVDPKETVEDSDDQNG